MHSRTEWPARISACRKAQARKQSRREKSRVSMAREGYRLWFCKCNDFNLHGVFSRDNYSLWVPGILVRGLDIQRQSRTASVTTRLHKRYAISGPFSSFVGSERATRS